MNESELGALRADVSNVRDTLTRIEAKVELVPTHQAQLETHKNQISALFRWKDGALGRGVGLASLATAAAACLTWLADYLK